MIGRRRALLAAGRVAMQAMRHRLLSLALLATLTGHPATAQQPALDCSSGPVAKTFGGTVWQVHACSDGKSIAVVTDSGSPAAPFYFFLFPKDGKYAVVGEGTGSKSLTDRAHADLKRLTDRDIASLVSEAKKLEPSKAPR